MNLEPAPKPTSLLRHRQVVVGALGIYEIFAWGSSFYLLSVLADPIARDTGWGTAGILGGLSAGLGVAGAVSPHIGRMIGRHGGRPILAASAIVTAGGLLALGLANSLSTYLLAWLVLGLGMGSGLYDPAYGTLGRLYGVSARQAITVLTLWAGFASTVTWPLSALMVEHVGWRGTCFFYAGIQLVVSMPLAVGLIPPAPVTDRQVSPGSHGRAAGVREPSSPSAFRTLAAIFAIGTTVTTLLSVHLMTMLQASGMPLSIAVSLGSLIGPAQVGARLLEMAGRGRHHPLWTLTTATCLTAVGISLLAVGMHPVALTLILYGAGNGIYSIARGTVPLALFGPQQYAAQMGRLAQPGLVAGALAPIAGAYVLSDGGSDALLIILAGLAAVNLGLVCLLWRLRPGSA